MRAPIRQLLFPNLTRTGLGVRQINWRALKTFWQPTLLSAGTIKNARREGQDITFDGPSSIYPRGRVRAYSFKSSALAAAYPGKTLAIVGIFGQSNGASTTDNANSVSDPNGAFTVLPPIPTRVLCFNGGPLPHQFGPNKGLGAETTLIDTGQIVSLVPAYETINPQCQGRETSLGMARMLATAAPDNWDILPINVSVGSCTYAEIFGSGGVPAIPYQNFNTCVSRAVTLAPGLGYSSVVILGIYVDGFESGTALNGVQNWLNLLSNTRTLLTASKALTGQSYDPMIIQPEIYVPRGTDAVHETNPAILDQISMQALGPVYAATNGSDVNFSTFARHEHVMGGDVETGVSGVHWSSLAHVYDREKAALQMINKLNGLSVVEPYILPNTAANPSRISRATNSATVQVTLSEGSTIRTDIGIAPPADGGEGFCYYTGGSRLAVSGIYNYSGGNKQTINSVSVNGTAVTPTLSAAASVVSGFPYITYAAEGATQFTAPVVATTNGSYGLGRKTGIRGRLFGTTPLGYSNMDGSTLERPVMSAILPVFEYYQTASMYDAAVAYGLTPDFYVDMRDIRCVASGSAQALTDIGTLGQNYWRGTNNTVEASDPTITGTPGSLTRSTYYNFNRAQWCTPQSATNLTTFLKDAHKASGTGHLIVLYQHVVTGNAQVILATCQGTGGSALQGVILQMSATNIPQFLVKDASNGTVFSATSTALADGDYAVLEIAWTAGGTYFFRTSKAPDPGTATCTFTSPSASAAQSALYIGLAGAGGPSGTRLNSNLMAILGWTTPKAYDVSLPVFNTGIHSQNENAY